jgi:Icc-related predicted phosphoesterase
MADLGIFFTSDIHGSEICFKKFINAGKYYGVNTLILGGDIVGKIVVPIIERPDGSRYAELLGEPKEIAAGDTDGLERLTWAVKNNGFYPYPINEEAFNHIRDDEAKKAAVFEDAIIQSLEGWMKIAEERLKGTGIQCYITPGNDDPFFIDEILSRSVFILNPEGQCIQLDDSHEMISSGFTNVTPWHCPRDIPEDELEVKLEGLCAQVKDMRACVIERHQPLISLHGHIHESRADCRIGQTTCINPGSEYSQGILKGALIYLRKEKIRSFMLTSG